MMYMMLIFKAESNQHFQQFICCFKLNQGPVSIRGEHYEIITLKITLSNAEN